MVKNVKGLLLNILILLIAIVLFLSVSELILSQKSDNVVFNPPGVFKGEVERGTLPRGESPYNPNSQGVFKQEGNIVTNVKINSQGFRDYEYSVKKPAGTFRILGFGDSFTWGHGVELDETYLKVLEKKLNSQNKNFRYEVLNFGVGGYKTVGSIEILKKNLDYKPDMIIILLSVNDAKLAEQIAGKGILKEKMINLPGFVDYVLTNSNTGFWVQVKIKAFNTRTSISNIQNDAEKFQETWNLVEPSLLELYQLSKENNFTIILLSDKNNIFLNEYVKFASKYDVLIMPFGLGSELRLADSHLNPSGHEFIAEMIYNTLIEKGLIPYE